MSNLIVTDDPGVIRDQSEVTLHFELRLSDGQVIDSNFAANPATLRIGDGNLPVGFEQYLMGLRAGDRRTFQVEADDAFGEHRADNVHRFSREQFRERVADAELEVGLLVSFAAPNDELPGTVSQVADDFVLVDFNHPLAGYVILFDVEIIAVAFPA